jgi:hypothetical protein
LFFFLPWKPALILSSLSHIWLNFIWCPNKMVLATPDVCSFFFLIFLINSFLWFFL